MLGRKRGAAKTVANAGGTVVGYVDPFMRDDRLRKKLVAAVAAGAAARSRVRQQTGVMGLARRLSTDPVLRAQLVELALAVRAVQLHVTKSRRTRHSRNTLIFVSGVGMTIAALPGVRNKLMSIVGAGGDDDLARLG